MTRPLRIEYQNAWYHVMNRGRRGENIFLEEMDYGFFLDILKEAVELWKVDICAYCLMPNHYHLLIRTPDANLSRCMRHINGVYTQRFNRRYRFDGPLFKGRFKSILIGEDSYLVELLRYICYNPVKANIVSKPEKYPWSCYNEYLGKSRQNLWLNTKLVTSRIVNATESSTKELLSSDAKSEIYDFFGKKNMPSLLGSKAFIDQIRNRFFERMVHPEKPEGKVLALDSNRILKTVSRYYQVSLSEIMKSKRGSSNTPRDVAIYLVRYISRLSLQKIGDIFDYSSYSGVSSSIERVNKRLAVEQILEKDITKLMNELGPKGQKKT